MVIETVGIECRDGAREKRLSPKRSRMMHAVLCVAFFTFSAAVAQQPVDTLPADLRFDREAALGMSEIELRDPPPASCRYDTPWIPPREALLNRRTPDSR